MNYLSYLMLACLTLACSFAPKSADKNPIAFINANIIDGKGKEILTKGVLIIEKGMITAVGDSSLSIPPNAKIINLEGKFIMPAMISNHNHLGSVNGLKVSPENFNKKHIYQELKQYQHYGILTVTSLGVNSDLIYDIKKDADKPIDVFTADRGIGAFLGAPPIPESFGEMMVTRPRNVTEARDYVKDMKERGADFVKLWLDDFLHTIPKMKPEIYKAVIDEAHKNNLRVSAHVYYLRDAQDLVRNGADILAHGIRDTEVGPSFVQEMKRKKVAYIPTLTLDETFFIYAQRTEWLDDSFFTDAVHKETLAKLQDVSFRREMLKNSFLPIRRQAIATNQTNVKRLFDAGVLVGFGTDSGANPWRFQGFAEHRELELLVEAGLTPLQAIQTATSNAAKVLGVNDRGEIVQGKQASFIILKENPAENIRNTRSIEAIWQKGKRVR